MNIGDKEKMMLMFFNIGKIYEKNNKKGEAFKYQNKGLEYVEIESDESEGSENIISKEDKEELMKMFTLIAYEYYEKGKYAEALQYYIKALEYAEIETEEYKQINSRRKKVILILLGEYRETVINEMENALEQKDLEKIEKILKGE